MFSNIFNNNSYILILIVLIILILILIFSNLFIENNEQQSEKFINVNEPEYKPNTITGNRYTVVYFDPGKKQFIQINSNFKDRTMFYEKIYRGVTEIVFVTAGMYKFISNYDLKNANVTVIGGGGGGSTIFSGSGAGSFSPGALLDINRIKTYGAPGTHGHVRSEKVNIDRHVEVNIIVGEGGIGSSSYYRSFQSKSSSPPGRYDPIINKRKPFTIDDVDNALVALNSTLIIPEKVVDNTSKSNSKIGKLIAEIENIKNKINNIDRKIITQEDKTYFIDNLTLFQDNLRKFEDNPSSDSSSSMNDIQKKVTDIINTIKAFEEGDVMVIYGQVRSNIKSLVNAAIENKIRNTIEYTLPDPSRPEKMFNNPDSLNVAAAVNTVLLHLPYIGPILRDVENQLIGWTMEGIVIAEDYIAQTFQDADWSVFERGFTDPSSLFSKSFWIDEGETYWIHTYFSNNVGLDGNASGFTIISPNYSREILAAGGKCQQLQSFYEDSETNTYLAKGNSRHASGGDNIEDSGIDIKSFTRTWGKDGNVGGEGGGLGYRSSGLGRPFG